MYRYQLSCEFGYNATKNICNTLDYVVIMIKYIDLNKVSSKGNL